MELQMNILDFTRGDLGRIRHLQHGKLIDITK